MKISDCTQTMLKANEAFNQYLANNKLVFNGITTDYNLVMSNSRGEHTINAVLIGTYINPEHAFQFPFHPENPAIKEEDRPFYRSLQEFGERARIPELTEPNISFDATMVMAAQAARRMNPPSIFRHYSTSEIVSCLTLEQLLSVAATFFQSTAYIALESSDYTVYLAILDEFNTNA